MNAHSLEKSCRGPSITTVALAILLAADGLLQGQPPREPLQRAGRSLHAEVLFRWRDDGKMEPFTVGTLDPSPRPSVLRLLQHETFAAELELAAFQVDEVKAIEASYRRNVKRIQQEFAAGKIALGNGDLGARLAAAEERAGEAMRKVLLPAQVRRLDEMIERCRARRNGFRHHIAQAIQKSDSGTSADLARLDAKARHVAADLARQVMVWRIETIDQLMAVLEPAQRETIRKLLGEAYYGSAPDVDVLMIQLAFRPPARPAAATDHPLAPMCAPHTFDVAFDGRLVPRQSGRKRLVPTLIEFLSRESTQDFLQLDDVQRDAVNDLYNRLQTLRNRQTEELTRAYLQSGVTRDKPVAQSLKQWWTRQREKLYRKLDGEIQELLDTRQRQRLTAYATRVGFIRRGHLAMLLDSRLRKSLGISPRQGKELLRQAARLRERLVEQSARLESRTYARLLDGLAPERRAKILSAMGRPIPGLPGALVVLRADLAGEISRRIGFPGSPPPGP